MWQLWRIAQHPSSNFKVMASLQCSFVDIAVHRRGWFQLELLNFNFFFCQCFCSSAHGSAFRIYANHYVKRKFIFNDAPHMLCVPFLHEEHVVVVVVVFYSLLFFSCSSSPPSQTTSSMMGFVFFIHGLHHNCWCCCCCCYFIICPTHGCVAGLSGPECRWLVLMLQAK